MVTEELTEREIQVFLSIVHGFVKTAEPVGSRYLAKHYKLGISPATIRNVMMDLEDKGMIRQPHTSSGRVPTTLGYRQYVDSLMGVKALTAGEKRTIIEEMSQISKDIELLTSKASQVLSKISSQLGIVLSPRFHRGILNKIELVSLSNNKLLLVLDIRSGLVKTIILELQEDFSDHFLQSCIHLLNERLAGLSISEIEKALRDGFTDVDIKMRLLVQMISDGTDQIFKAPTPDFYVSGAKNVLDQPEFYERERIGKILELLDNKDILIRVLSEQESDGVSIVIGDENRETLMKNCSLITTTYQIKDSLGTLGVIGPTRMRYDKIIALVQFMADTLSYLINKNE